MISLVSLLEIFFLVDTIATKPEENKTKKSKTVEKKVEGRFPPKKRKAVEAVPENENNQEASFSRYGRKLKKAYTN